MNQWDEAARKAADRIRRTVGDTSGYDCDESSEIIAKHHADLRATYEKLTRLAIAWQEIKANSGCSSYSIHADPLDKAWGKATKLLADPLVQSAIERSKV